MEPSKYCVIYAAENNPDSVILFSTKRASAILVARSILAAIENGEIDEEERLILTDLGFLVANHEQEKQEMLRYIDELNEIDTKLSFIVAMNLDCNLACTYCFEGSRKGKHYMSPETAGDVIDFIEKNLTQKKRISECDLLRRRAAPKL
jgi:uncharacterized protein